MYGTFDWALSLVINVTVCIVKQTSFIPAINVAVWFVPVPPSELALDNFGVPVKKSSTFLCKTRGVA